MTKIAPCRRLVCNCLYKIIYKIIYCTGRPLSGLYFYTFYYWCVRCCCWLVLLGWARPHWLTCWVATPATTHWRSMPVTTAPLRPSALPWRPPPPWSLSSALPLDPTVWSWMRLMVLQLYVYHIILFTVFLPTKQLLSFIFVLFYGYRCYYKHILFSMVIRCLFNIPRHSTFPAFPLTAIHQLAGEHAYWKGHREGQQEGRQEERSNVPPATCDLHLQWPLHPGTATSQADCTRCPIPTHPHCQVRFIFIISTCLYKVELFVLSSHLHFRVV